MEGGLVWCAESGDVGGGSCGCRCWMWDTNADADAFWVWLSERGRGRGRKVVGKEKEGMIENGREER